jgi:putative transposase
MPVHKKQHTTPHQHPTVPQASSEPVIPGPEGFQAFLRAEIRQASRLVMEEIMCEELTQFVGAKWGEISAERKGYRNGFYTRDLKTTNGPIED